MSAKAIREYDGKRMISQHIRTEATEAGRPVPFDQHPCVLIGPDTDLGAIAKQNPWLEFVGTGASSSRLVVKPDQRVKRRGKRGLIGMDLDWAEVKEWIAERMNREVELREDSGSGGASTTVKGVLTHFIVEPFVPHEPADEYYVLIESTREGEEIMFWRQGGIHVGDVSTMAARLQVPIDDDRGPTEERIICLGILDDIPYERREPMASFLCALLKVYRKLNFTFMEMNPIVYQAGGGVGGGDRIVALDLAAKIDETAAFLNAADWGPLDFPPVFGMKDLPEEAYVRDLDSRTGASLKLTILNPHGRIWTMVAGGGASVIFADTIADLGWDHELANYGEYSGDPPTELTYEYAKTLIDLMTRDKEAKDRILLIGGGIANFTDVAATFTGIIQALDQYQYILREQHAHIWVRRAGPNYQRGLQLMREFSENTGLGIHIYGPETPVTAIVPLALGVEDVANFPEFDSGTSEVSLVTSPVVDAVNKKVPPKVFTRSTEGYPFNPQDAHLESHHVFKNFNNQTRCVVYGLQERAVQGCLDFDYMCGRQMPSVAAIVYPFATRDYQINFFFGKGEILVPVLRDLSKALSLHPEVSVIVNFASCRSVHSSVMEMLEYSNQINTIAIIAEGVPESQTRAYIKAAKKKNVGIIGPATVGGIKPGSFRIGNAGKLMLPVLGCLFQRLRHRDVF